MQWRLDQNLPSLVIHSVPVWVLADMGLVGAALMLGGFATLVVGLWRYRRSPVGRCGLVAALLFALGGLVHDFFYQRSFWFALGLFAAWVTANRPAAGEEITRSIAVPSPLDARERVAH